MKITDPQIINLASEMDADINIYIHKDSKKEAVEAAETFSKILGCEYVTTYFSEPSRASIRIGDVLNGVFIDYRMSDEEKKEYYLEEARKLEKEG